MNKILVGLVLATLLVGMLAFAFGVNAVIATGTVYVRADGSIDPPAAPMQRNGSVYILTDNITSDADGIVVERDNIVVDGSGFAVEGTGAMLSHGMYLVGRSNVTIKNTYIRHFGDGIGLDSSSNNIISGNNIMNNSNCGVWLGGSSNSNSITRNAIIKNLFDGVWIEFSSNNSVSENTITASSADGIGLASSSHNRIDGNTVTNNGGGIWLFSTSDNSIRGNTLTNNSNNGILLYFSSNSSINGNKITNNTNFGIWLKDSFSNTVCHNNFINNTVQAAEPNFWDNGCEGNYWSNYNGTDLDGDGVGDVYLPWEGVDDYPLMNVYWNPCDINHDLKVNMKDVGRSAKAFGTRAGYALWNPHADITGPEPLVPDGKVDMRDISPIAKDFPEDYS